MSSRRAGQSGGVGRLSHQYFARLCRFLDARGRIDRIAERGEVEITLAADIADIGDAGIDADADRQPGTFGGAVAEAAHQRLRRLDRHAHEARPGEARHEKSHHLVADQLVDRRLVAHQRLGRHAVEPVERRRECGRTELLRERGRAAHVSEQDGGLDLRAAGRQLLAAERAQHGVLARRPEAHRTADMAAEAAEGVVADLAARRAGQQMHQLPQALERRVPLHERRAPDFLLLAGAAAVSQFHGPALSLEPASTVASEGREITDRLAARNGVLAGVLAPVVPD